MKRIEGFDAPQIYRAALRGRMLGGGMGYLVQMNNHTDISFHGNSKDAELEAARLNYVHGCGQHPKQIGLDGVPQ